MDDDAASQPAREPDYRMSLAAERTYLAYVRTGLALLAAGVAVAGALNGAGAQTLRRVVGVLLVLIGGAVLVIARLRWTAVRSAMRHGAGLPEPRAIGWLGWVLAVLAAVAVAVVLSV